MEKLNLETAHQAFKELGLTDKAKNNKFEWFSRHLMNKSLILVVNNLLSYLDTKLSARELLSTFIIANYPDDALSTEMDLLENNVYQSAKLLIDLLNKETLIKAEITSKCDRSGEKGIL